MRNPQHTIEHPTAVAVMLLIPVLPALIFFLALSCHLSAAGSPVNARYTFGAKFEPPAGRIIHGMGQFEKGNLAYMKMLDKPSIFPVTSLLFLALGEQPRPWKYRLDNLNRFLGQASREGMMPHVSLHLRGDKQKEYDPEQTDYFAVDDEIEKTTKLDARILDVVKAVKAYGRPVFVRIGGEFNGPWNGYHPYTFPKAFRKIVKMFRDNGVENAAFVWCYIPSASDDFDTRNPEGQYKWFPGLDVIDWFGIDLFSPESFRSRSRDRGASRAPSAHTMTTRFLAMAKKSRKPVMIAESSAAKLRITADPGVGDRYWNAWFKPYFDLIGRNNVIKAFYYINTDWGQYAPYRKQGWTDARININPRLETLYLAEISKSRYLHRDEISLLKDYDNYTAPDSD